MKLTIIAYCNGCGASIMAEGTDTAYVGADDSFTATIQDAAQRHRTTTPTCPYYDVIAAKEGGSV